MNLPPSPLSDACSFLFVPATQPERYGKALASGADGVIIDLEDAVGLDDKAKAREILKNTWSSISIDQKHRIVVRCNAPGSSFYAADLVLAKELQVRHLMIPKTESRNHVNGAAEELKNTAFIPMIETPLGLHHLNEIASAEQVLRLALGNLDMQVELGISCDDNETEIDTARFMLVLASKLAQIAPPLDGVTPSTDDEPRIFAHAQKAKRFGFGAKLCIHPKQIPIVKRAFTPSPEELDWAKRVISADKAAKGQAVKVDGKMVDRPVVMLARRILVLAGNP
jgi:citrate lyase subunit beta / citryl-CoA lyase